MANLQMSGEGLDVALQYTLVLKDIPAMLTTDLPCWHNWQNSLDCWETWTARDGPGVLETHIFSLWAIPSLKHYSDIVSDIPSEDTIWGFPTIGLPLVIIRFRLGFSPTKTIHFEDSMTMESPISGILWTSLRLRGIHDEIDICHHILQRVNKLSSLLI